MKKMLVLLLALLLLIGCSSALPSEEAVQAQQLYNQIANHANRAYLESVFAKQEAAEHFDEVALPEDINGVQAQLTEGEAVCKQCETLGIRVDRDQTKRIADEEYQRLPTDNANYYALLEQAWDAFGVSEEQYVQLLYDQAYYQYNQIALKQYFVEHLSDSDSDQSIEEQFDRYLDGLL